MYIPSNAFTPADIPNLQIWSDASDASTINSGSPVNGDLVANWNDKSGHNKNWLQATGARKPTYTTNIVNGLPGLNFVASTTNFMALTSGYNLGPIYTVYIVYRPTSTTNHWIFGDTAMSIGMLVAFAGGNTLNDFDPGGGSFSNSSTTPNNTNLSFLSTVNTTSASGIHYKNWATQTMSSGGANFDMTFDAIGTRASGAFGAGQSCDGYMMEIAIWNRVITSGERAQLQAYSVAKWGV